MFPSMKIGATDQPLSYTVTQPLVLPTNDPYHSTELQLHDFQAMADTLDSLGHTQAAVELYTVVINRYENLSCFPKNLSRSVRIKRGSCNARLGRLSEAEKDLSFVAKLPLSSPTFNPPKRRMETLRRLFSSKTIR